MIDLQFGLAPLILLLLFLVAASIKILREYERGVIFLLLVWMNSERQNLLPSRVQF